MQIKRQLTVAVSWLFILLIQNVDAEWWYLSFLSAKIASIAPPPKPSQLTAPQALSLIVPQGLSRQRKELVPATDDRLKKAKLRRYCSSRKIFTSPLQRNICKKNSNIVQVFSRAAKLAVNECQYQLKYERWNCSISKKSLNVYGDVVKTKSRETAFIYALNAAASMYEITRACSRGELKNCACYVNEKSKETPNAGPEGCNENVVYGRKLSRIFVDSQEYFDLTKIEALKIQRRSKDYNEMSERRLMNLHNNEVGRRIIMQNLKKKCKCHGVSGSCSVRVCWLMMPDFRVIGDELRRQYDAASKINKPKAVERVELLKTLVTKRSTRSTIQHSYSNELLYIRNSPDYCKSNGRLGISGTRGRMCSSVESTSNTTVATGDFDSDGGFLDAPLSPNETCDYICCGRGFHSKRIETYEDCECKFQFCCTVTCQKCKKITVQYFCN